MKRNTLLILIPLAAALGASAVKLSQLRGAPTASILVSMPDGSVKQSGVMSGISVDPATGNIVVAAQQNNTPVPPRITLYNIANPVQSTFPIPMGASVCIVSNGHLLNFNEDYQLNAGNIIMQPGLNFPVPGDTIQTICF